MTSTASKPLTLEEFLKLPETKPADRSVLLFLPGQQPELLQGGDRLLVLEEIELELTVNQVFEWLKMGVYL